MRCYNPLLLLLCVSVRTRGICINDGYNFVSVNSVVRAKNDKNTLITCFKIT